MPTGIIEYHFFPIQHFKNNEGFGIKLKIPSDMMEFALSKHNGDREKAEKWCLSQIYSKMTDSVTHSVLSALDDAKIIQLNQICYCQQTLKRRKATAAQSTELICRSCWRVLSLSEVYVCANEQCVFKERTELQFYICPSCFTTKSENDEKEDDTQKSLIGRKTTESLGIIS